MADNIEVKISKLETDFQWTKKLVTIGIPSAFGFIMLLLSIFFGITASNLNQKINEMYDDGLAKRIIKIKKTLNEIENTEIVELRESIEKLNNDNSIVIFDEIIKMQQNLNVLENKIGTVSEQLKTHITKSSNIVEFSGDWWIKTTNANKELVIGKGNDKTKNFKFRVDENGRFYAYKPTNGIKVPAAYSGSQIYVRSSDNGYGLTIGTLSLSPGVTCGGYLQTMLNDEPKNKKNGQSIPLFLNPSGGTVAIGTTVASYVPGPLLSVHGNISITDPNKGFFIGRYHADKWQKGAWRIKLDSTNNLLFQYWNGTEWSTKSEMKGL